MRDKMELMSFSHMTSRAFEFLYAKSEVCRKSLEKNFELLHPNTSFRMRVEYPFINEINSQSKNLALATEFLRDKKRMEHEWKKMTKRSSNKLAKVSQ